ncbi:hypothetical protein SRHO_G00297250 [Serrasalmus rhombeus]
MDMFALHFDGLMQSSPDITGVHTMNNDMSPGMVDHHPVNDHPLELLTVNAHLKTLSSWQELPPSTQTNPALPPH